MARGFCLPILWVAWRTVPFLEPVLCGASVPPLQARYVAHDQHYVSNLVPPATLLVTYKQANIAGYRNPRSLSSNRISVASG